MVNPLSSPDHDPLLAPDENTPINKWRPDPGLSAPGCTNAPEAEFPVHESKLPEVFIPAAAITPQLKNPPALSEKVWLVPTAGVPAPFVAYHRVTFGDPKFVVGTHVLPLLSETVIPEFRPAPQMYNPFAPVVSSVLVVPLPAGPN
jgi:hypothetical protein